MSTRSQRLALQPGEMAANHLQGLCGFAIRSHKEVANILGLTRQRVQQIERQALLRLRRWLTPERDKL